jgi:exodeoxyribonuclease VII large subunit
MQQNNLDFDGIGPTDDSDTPVFGVSDFVATLNQILEYSFPIVQIEGEVSNFAVRKDKWVYFDIKDESSSVRVFGTIYGLPGPVEDGMMVKIVASPRLHNLYGFSLNFQSVHPIGEGSIKKSFDLLKQKLEKEGLFAPEKKRPLPYPPKKIGLIASAESAGYKDFLKIINNRWPHIDVQLANVQVQGVRARNEIVSAINYFNRFQEVEVLVIVRGGGSTDDLAEFSTEEVTRAVAGSRIPTLVAIGHEIDTALAELAADKRAITPSHAAEILVPSRYEHLGQLDVFSKNLYLFSQARIDNELLKNQENLQHLGRLVSESIDGELDYLVRADGLLFALNPDNLLEKGYSITRNKSGGLVRGPEDVNRNDILHTKLRGGTIESKVMNKKSKEQLK